MVAKLTPLVVIVGETASGKSDLAMQLAKKFNGEIIAADSKTIYRGMDIGTAKPSIDDRRMVKHHLIDIIEPGNKYSAAQFKEDALKAINDIYLKGKLPIMVGGSGLYIDSVIFDYQFSDPKSPRDTTNSRHMSKDIKTEKSELRENTVVIGMKVENEILEDRIRERVEKMVNLGFLAETKSLLDNYGSECDSFLAPGYRAFIKHIKGEISLDEAKEQFIKGDLMLAKRQRTWFKRNKSIHWVKNLPQNGTKQSEAVELVTTLLQKT